VPKDVCQRHGLIPVSRAGSSLIVAMSDPSNLHAVDGRTRVHRATAPP
jgi:type IV pilus assembly protein PilB